MTNESEIHDRVLRLFVVQMNRDVSSPDLDLLESGTLDSMSLVELLLHLETEFGVAIDLGDIELDLLRSVAGITEMVQGFLSVEQSRRPAPLVTA